VTRRDGTAEKDAVVGKGTGGEGAVWDIAFSPDPGSVSLRRRRREPEGLDPRARVARRRWGSVGAGGRWPGHFFGVGSVAVDSKGHLYTGETYEGKRVQKFVPQGKGGGQ
jgi:hypothetical protein